MTYSRSGLSRTDKRIRNESAQARFLEKQLDLFARISSPVTPARSEARTAGTGEEKLYVLVTRKVSPFKRKIAQNLSSSRHQKNGVGNA